eukprot:3428529-Rhodomonas_salina.1
MRSAYAAVTSLIESTTLCTTLSRMKGSRSMREANSTALITSIACCRSASVKSARCAASALARSSDAAESWPSPGCRSSAEAAEASAAVVDNTAPEDRGVML